MSLRILYKPSFVKKYRKLPKELQEEVKEKIALFKEDPNHPFLKTHKLHGPMKGSWSFSVNYQYRVVFEYTSPECAEFLTIGDHDIYR